MKIEETARRLSIEKYSSHRQLPYDAHRDGIAIGIREGLKMAIRTIEVKFEGACNSVVPWLLIKAIRDILDGKAEIPTDIPEEVSAGE